MSIDILTKDAKQLQQTARLIFNAWSALPLWSDEKQIISRLRARIDAPDHQVVLISTDADGRVIATGSLIRYELSDNVQRIYWLGEVVTDIASRGKGVASALIEHCLLLAARKA